MEKLLEMAKKISDQSEIYSLDKIEDDISFENSKLKDIESKSQSGICLRIIKENKLGFAYTKNLTNRDELIRNAVDSLKGGVDGEFDFPLTQQVPGLNSYEPSVEDLSNTRLVDECGRICDLLSPKTDGQINLSAGQNINKIRVLNSQGTDIAASNTSYYLYSSICYPGSYSSINRIFDVINYIVRFLAKYVWLLSIIFMKDQIDDEF